MPRVYYKYEGGKPFRFTYSGCEYVIQPPDKFWKSAKERYKAGSRYNPISGMPIPGGDVFREKTVWIPDEERNKTGLKPRNWLDMTDKMWNYAKQRAGELREYLETDNQIHHRFEDEVAAKREHYDQEIELERRNMEQELARIREDHERRVLEMNAQYAATEENVKETMTRSAKKK